MHKIALYLKGIIISPTKTLEKIVEDKNLVKYLIFQIIALSIIAFLNSIVYYHSSVKSPLFNTVEEIIRKYNFILTPIFFLFHLSLLGLIARLFSKKGKLIQLLVAVGFIDLIFNSISLILTSWVSFLIFARTFFDIWAYILTIIALSVVYKISKGTAFVITLIPLAIILGLIVIYFTFFFLSSYIR